MAKYNSSLEWFTVRMQLYLEGRREPWTEEDTLWLRQCILEMTEAIAAVHEQQRRESREELVD